MKYVFLDTETTGVEPGSRMVEIGAIKIDSATPDQHDIFHFLVKPGLPVPPDVSLLHGIFDGDLIQAESTGTAVKGFSEFVADADLLVAHNAPFDIGIVSLALDEFGLSAPSAPVVCTLALARRIKQTSDNKLGTIAAHHGIATEGGHRALADARVCAQYFTKCWIDHPLDQLLASPWLSPGWFVHKKDLPVKLLELPAILSQGGALKFDYTDAKGVASVRNIIPYGYARGKGGISVHGLDLDKQERRMFLADRMTL